MPYHQFDISVPSRFKEAVVKRLFELGSLGVMDCDENIIACFPDAVSADAVATELGIMGSILETAGYGRALSYGYATIHEADWNETWKKGFNPIDVGGRLTILPPWEKQRPGRINIIIDPGMAFGTGHHETTKACLVLMERYSEKTQKKRFLDLGTGTGILGIAASKIGFEHILCIDTDPIAVAATKKNIELNHVPNVDVRQGSVTAADGTYDVIAANLYSSLLIRLAHDIAARLNPGGVAVLAGMLRGQEAEVLDAADQAGLEAVETHGDGKWLASVVKAKACKQKRNAGANKSVDNKTRV